MHVEDLLCAQQKTQLAIKEDAQKIKHGHRLKHRMAANPRSMLKMYSDSLKIYTQAIIILQHSCQGGVICMRETPSTDAI